MNDITIALAGNLVDDPELRYTPNGTAVANFRLASTPRMEKNGRWIDAADTVYLDVVAWRGLGENVTETLTKGARVVVVGRLRQRSYEKDGEKRTVYEIHADEVCPSLRMATATVTKLSRSDAPPAAGEEAPAA